jgi:ABC-type nitrate/sulfonate/bicarbonate transport system permease component
MGPDDPGMADRRRRTALSSRLISWVPKFVPPAVLLAVLIAVWQVAVKVFDVSTAVLPPPSLIVTATWDDRTNLWPAVWTTSRETVFGLLVAIVVGFLIATVIDSSRVMSHSLYPLIIASQTLPIIALAPLVVIWFGFGIVPKILIVALFSFFPIAVGLVQGLASAEPDTINLLRTMGAKRWQLLRRARLPHALPQFFTGLKISVTYSFAAAIIAEFVGAQQGLGVYMIAAKNAAPALTDLVFGAVFVTALLTCALFLVVALLQRLAMPWRPRK